MDVRMIVGIVIGVVILGIFIFHVIHHRLFCRYRKVPGKSHCGECGHREICQKYHHKNDR